MMRHMALMSLAAVALLCMTAAEPGGVPATEDPDNTRGTSSPDEGFTGGVDTAAGGEGGDGDDTVEGATDADKTDPLGGHDKPDNATE